MPAPNGKKTVKKSAAAQQTSNNAVDTCSICLESSILAPGKPLMTCGTCRKAIHVECAMKLKTNTCPNCRAKLFDQAPAASGSSASVPRPAPVVIGQDLGAEGLQDVAPLPNTEPIESAALEAKPTVKVHYAPGIKVDGSGGRTVGHGVVSIVCPDPPGDVPRGAGVDIVALLDVSGSMSGEKLNQTKNTLEFLIDELEGPDRLSIITFDHNTKILSPLSPMDGAGKARATSISEGLAVGSTTKLGAGLQKVCEVLNARRVKRRACILVMTDGQTSDQGNLHITNFKHGLNNDCMDYTLFTFAFGADHDTQLLSKLAQDNGGTYQYMQDPDEFSESVGDVLSQSVLGVALCQAKLKLSSNNAAELKPVLVDEGNIGNMVWESRKDILFSVNRPSSKKMKVAKPIEASITASFSYKTGNVDSKKTKSTKRLVRFGKTMSAPAEDQKIVLISKFRREVAELLENATKSSKKKIEDKMKEIEKSTVKNHDDIAPLLESCKGTIKRLTKNDRSLRSYTTTASHGLKRMAPVSVLRASKKSYKTKSKSRRVKNRDVRAKASKSKRSGRTFF